MTTAPACSDSVTPVAQTGGVVSATTATVPERLAQLDFSANNLGWSVDWAAIAFRAVQDPSLVPDATLRIQHPPSMGYHDAEAHPHAKNFIGRLPQKEQIRVSQTFAQLMRVKRKRNVCDDPVHSY